VLLAGAFGQRNPGDEALLSAFLHGLAGADIIVASADPEHTHAHHAVPSISSSSKRALQRAVAESTALVFAGGTVFKTLPSSTGRPPLSLLRNAFAISAYARLRGCSVLMVGVGTGALNSPAACSLARRLAGQADLLIVRDEASAKRLVSCGVPAPLRVGADAAWTLVDEPTTESLRSDQVVVVPSRWAADESVRPDLAATLGDLHTSGLRVRLDPWQVDGSNDDDLGFSRQLAAAMPGAVQITDPPRSLTDAIRRLRGSRLVVTMRFHAQVAAAAAGAPCLSLVHDSKQSSLATRLGQPNLAVDAGAASVTAAIRAALHHPPPAPATVKSEIAAAHSGFDLLRLMTGLATPPVESIGGLRLEPST
jgi:polysaccharide pyruvyl transferase WcaK-like protein